ncbi:hypothetical protein PRIPAC_96217 [Pristionchus pacificus]|uniref:CC domain-containing protein n=1 Tax=Pristionchus pacificus TaxID=54126 RepID=A0A2A6CTP4_PRIPA|nr:hypothetical protein PRIPAC_96217 [Pristionchus pacificus]|eukprot:PDM81555.1 hypothetical protein PRIPAC_30536 [Pristionchus pacificus]
MKCSPLVLGCFVALATCQTKGVFESAVGPCIDDSCPSGSSCYYGQCIPSEIAPKMPEPEKNTALGACRYGGMCDKDQYCYHKECYPHPKLD